MRGTLHRLGSREQGFTLVETYIPVQKRQFLRKPLTDRL